MPQSTRCSRSQHRRRRRQRRRERRNAIWTELLDLWQVLLSRYYLLRPTLFVLAGVEHYRILLPPPQKKTKLYDIVLFLHPLVVSGPSCPCVFKYSIYSHRKKNWKGNHQSPNTFVPSNLTLSQSNKSIQIKKIELYLGSDIQSKHDTKAPNKRRYKFN